MIRKHGDSDLVRSLDASAMARDLAAQTVTASATVSVPFCPLIPFHHPATPTHITLIPPRVHKVCVIRNGNSQKSVRKISDSYSTLPFQLCYVFCNSRVVGRAESWKLTGGSDCTGATGWDLRVHLHTHSHRTNSICKYANKTFRLDSYILEIDAKL